MPDIRWDPSYSVGVEEIDLQHQAFIKIINKLQWAHGHGYPGELCVRLVRELRAYAVFHFMSEENLMLLHRYPALPHQEKEHRKLLEILDQKVQGVERGQEDLDGTSRFLFMWLISHTTEEDVKLGRYLSGRSLAHGQVQP